MDELLNFLLVWCLLAVLVGVPVGAINALTPRKADDSLWGPQRVRAAPWRLMDAALAAVVFVGLDYVGATLFGVRSPERVLAATLRGETQCEAAAGMPGGGFSSTLPLLRSAATYALEAADQARRQVWAVAVTRPIQFIALLLLFTVVAGGRTYQLGLTLRRWPRVLLAAYLVWLVITPLAKLAFWLLLQIETPKAHPVDTLLRFSDTLDSWGLVLFTVLISAPLLEELLFRGFAQQIMVNSPEVADLTLLAVLIGIIVSGTTQVWEEGSLRTGWPIVLLIGTGAGYLGFERLMQRWLPRPGAARAIYATSVLFALVHSSHWPTPIPLFFLSLGLGYLGYRTQSLLGPLVVHSLFNLTTIAELYSARLLD